MKIKTAVDLDFSRRMPIKQSNEVSYLVKDWGVRVGNADYILKKLCGKKGHWSRIRLESKLVQTLKS